MNRLISLFVLYFILTPVSHAEILFDPLTFLQSSSSGGGTMLVGGLTVTSETDYDLEDIVEGTANRQTLDLGGMFAIQPNTGVYGTMLYNIGSDIEGDRTFDLEGFQFAIGGFRQINNVGDFPTVVWGELNLVKESIEGSFEGISFSDDLSGTELSAGALFRVVENETLTVSAGPELILMSNGEVDSEGETTDVERADKFGVKALAQYPLNDRTIITGYLNLISETKIGLSISFPL